MSGIGHFLRTYEFLNLTKSVTEAQLALYKEPNKTWSQIGGKLYSISWLNGLSIAAVGADVAAYLAVSTLRSVGLFRPAPPKPPVFPSPHDNVEFLDYAIRRALWNWEPLQKKEMEEAIDASYPEAFQTLGEWSFAYSLEHREKGSYYRPTFLTVSETLENGASFRSVLNDFGKLWKSEQQAILNALYSQTQPSSLGGNAKKVYSDIRAIASKLHQGNQNFLSAYSKYAEGKAAAQPPAPSAPPFQERSFERQMAEDVAFLREAIQELPRAAAGALRSEALRGRGKETIAALAVLRGFKTAYQEQSGELPSFFPLDAQLPGGRSVRSAGIAFASLNDRDFLRLQEAAATPYLAHSLPPSLKSRLDDTMAVARLLASSPGFIRACEALQIDLLAT